MPLLLIVLLKENMNVKNQILAGRSRSISCQFWNRIAFSYTVTLKKEQSKTKKSYNICIYQNICQDCFMRKSLFWLNCDRVRKFVSKLTKWRSGEFGIYGWTIRHRITKLFGHFFGAQENPLVMLLRSKKKLDFVYHFYIRIFMGFFLFLSKV